MEPPLLVAIITISHCSQPAATNNQVLEVLGCVNTGRQKKKLSEADKKEGKTPEIGIPLVTAPQGGTKKYTLAFAYDSPR